jgi:hypothetical protein
MQKVYRLVVAAVIAVAAMVGFAATPASATGQYVYYCTGPDGRTFQWNTDSYKCNGWIDKYIDGNRVAHVRETKAYAAWRNGGVEPAISTDCQFAAGLFWLVLASGEPIGWVGIATGLMGTGYACA